MSRVARFRPFGRRQDGPAAHEPDPWLDDPPHRGMRAAGPDLRGRSFGNRPFDHRPFDEGPLDARPFDDHRPFDDRDPDPWDADAWDADAWDAEAFGPSIPATRAATPAMWAPRPADLVEEDRAPVTDPFGFPPVPPVVGTRDDAPAGRDPAPAWAAWVPDRGPRPTTPRAEETGRPLPSRGPADESPRPTDQPGDAVGRAADRAPEARAQGVDSPWAVDSAGATTRSGTATRPDRDDGRSPGGGVPTGASPPRDGTVPSGRVAEDGDPDGPPARSHEPARPAEPTANPSVRPAGSAANPPARPAEMAVSAPDRPDTPVDGTVAPPDRRGEPATPDPAESAALAGAFAADYLSWDEDDPARRGRALSDHLPGPGGDHALLGWSGTGRQRAEIVLPGAVRPDGDGRLLVDVRVRVTPYRRVSRSEATPEPDPRDALGTPSAAPPATARGWRGLAARWVRLGVTVVRDGDRLVVDAGEETFDEPTAERHRPLPAPARLRAVEDPTLDGDDVVSAGSGR